MSDVEPILPGVPTLPVLPVLPVLTGLTPTALGALMPREGRPSLTRGQAVWRWLRQTGLPSAWPDEIPDLGRAAYAELRTKVTLPEVTVEPDGLHRSADGTLKWRLRAGGAPIETVLIPTERRATICVSSQSGCTRFCDFCATAHMPFGRQLSTADIVAQVLLARAHATPEAPATNVVFMGMGEPLDNLEAVLGAVEVLEQGVGIAPSHMTVSTSGVLPRLAEFCRRSRAAIAVSLHATTQDVRDRLMPKVARWPLAALLAEMRAISSSDPQRIFFVELTLIDGLNDSDADADRLVTALASIHARVNLIPVNQNPGMPYRRPSPERVDAFRARVVAAGVVCVVRRPRGDDSAAACGQLTTNVASLSPAPRGA